MTKEETAECIKVMQAFTNGEIIEEKRFSFDTTEWVESIDPSWQWYKFDYRIKPRHKYRPFKNAEECWKEMLKHQPFGWVKVINRYKNILELRDSKNGIELLEENWTYKELCERVTFVDGTPFGIREC